MSSRCMNLKQNQDQTESWSKNHLKVFISSSIGRARSSRDVELLDPFWFQFTRNTSSQLLGTEIATKVGGWKLSINLISYTKCWTTQNQSAWTKDLWEALNHMTIVPILSCCTSTNQTALVIFTETSTEFRCSNAFRERMWSLNMHKVTNPNQLEYCENIANTGSQRPSNIEMFFPSIWTMENGSPFPQQISLVSHCSSTTWIDHYSGIRRWPMAMLNGSFKTPTISHQTMKVLADIHGNLEDVLFKAIWSRIPCVGPNWRFKHHKRG